MILKIMIKIYNGINIPYSVKVASLHEPTKTTAKQVLRSSEPDFYWTNFINCAHFGNRFFMKT